MAESVAYVNAAGTATGIPVALYTDASGKDHQEVIIQTQTGGNDPVSVGASNPLPIALTAANGTMNIAAGGTVAVNNYPGTQVISLSAANGTVNVNGTVVISLAGANGTVNLVGTIPVNLVAGGVPAQVDNSTFTAGTSSGLTILCVYNDAITALGSNSAAVPRMSSTRQLLVAPQAVVNGGWTPATYISNGGTNTGTNVKNSPGVLASVIVGNNSTNTAYLKLYNSGTAPRMGTDTPVQNILIPGNTTGAGFSYPITAPGLNFSTGIGFGLSAGIALLDVSVVATNAITVNFGYL